MKRKIGAAFWISPKTTGWLAGAPSFWRFSQESIDDSTTCFGCFRFSNSTRAVL